jgi:hypothetical protein
MDLVFRGPLTAQVAWALLGDVTRRVLELCQDIARDKTLTWLEKAVAEIRWGSGGKHRRPVKDGLIVAVFRHHESRAGKPLLHDHAVISLRARRPDDKGTWDNLSADSMLAHIVAAGTLYTIHFMEEVSARLGWAWEPREVTSGRRPVLEIAGIDQRLIGRQSTRRQQIADALPVLIADYEEAQGTRRGSGPPTRWTGRPPTGHARRSEGWRGRCPSCATAGGIRRSGRSAPALCTGWQSGRGRRPRRCERGCGRWSTKRWRPSTSPPWCT